MTIKTQYIKKHNLYTTELSVYSNICGGTR